MCRRYSVNQTEGGRPMKCGTGHPVLGGEMTTNKSFAWECPSFLSFDQSLVKYNWPPSRDELSRNVDYLALMVWMVPPTSSAVNNYFRQHEQKPGSEPELWTYGYNPLYQYILCLLYDPGLIRRGQDNEVIIFMLFYRTLIVGMHNIYPIMGTF